MYTKDGIVVMLPEDNPLAAIATLVVLNTNHNILNKQIQVIDMRDATRILVK
jgi:cell division septal protein FtsQ